MNKPPRRNTRFLCLILLSLIVCLFLLEQTKGARQKPLAPLMREAAERTARAFEAVRLEKERRGLPLAAGDDPNRTGLIGLPYSEITTTLGSLEAKRSTTNPNVAAMLVEMFDELGLAQGDRIAVNMSGSFPALNIAVTCAMDAMGLTGTLMFSVGASTYGANDPAFTYGDMERYLASAGFIERTSAYFSLGGQNDQGLEMPPQVRETIVSRLTAWGLCFLDYADLDRNSEERCALYLAQGPVRCLVNVGGNELSFGSDPWMLEAASGILTVLPRGNTGNGLAQRFLREGVPVIQLLNMKSLLPAYRLPYDPAPLPGPGEGDVYWESAYSPWLLALSLALASALLGLFALRRKPGRA